MIFYFTGTGNCLYAASELAAINEEVLSIPREMRREGALAYAADSIGVVYPVYGHEMPQMVKDFIRRASFDTPYLYLVATYGCRHANAVELALAEAREADFEPAYATTLLMVDNWLPNFDMKKQRSGEAAKDVDGQLARIRRDVSERRRWIEPVGLGDRLAHKAFLAMGLTFTPERLTDFLRIDGSACIGCGVCSRVCPAGCISIEADIAHRDALAGFGCNACLACIHACPAHAISLPMGEKNPRARFRNSHVELRDIETANS